MRDELRPMVRRTLAHWHIRATVVDDTTLAEFGRNEALLRDIITQTVADDEFQLQAAQLLCDLLSLIERRGYAPQWIPVHQYALKALHPNSNLYWQVAVQIGSLYCLLRNWPAAITALTAVLDHKDAPVLAKANASLYMGNLYYEQRRLSDADTYSFRAQQLYAELEPNLPARKIATTATLQGLVASAMQDIVMGDVYFAHAVTVWQQVGDHTFLGRTLNNWGEMYLSNNHIDAALPLFDRAIAQLAKTDSELDKTRVHINRGVYFLGKEDWQAAKDAFILANSDFLRQSADIFLQAHVSNNLAGALIELGELDKAEHHLRDSIIRWIELDDRFMWGNSLGGLAEVLALRQHIVEAKATYREAIAILQQVKTDMRAMRRLQEIEQELTMLEQVDGDCHR